MGYLNEWKRALNKESLPLEVKPLEVKPLEDSKLEMPRWARENEEWIQEVKRKKK